MLRVCVNIGMCTLSPSCKHAMIGTGTFSTPSKKTLPRVSKTQGKLLGGLRPAAAATAADEVDSGDVALAHGESIFELAAM